MGNKRLRQQALDAFPKTALVIKELEADTVDAEESSEGETDVAFIQQIEKQRMILDLAKDGLVYRMQRQQKQNDNSAIGQDKVSGDGVSQAGTKGSPVSGNLGEDS
jgi:hypothetical protein